MNNKKKSEEFGTANITAMDSVNEKETPKWFDSIQNFESEAFVLRQLLGALWKR